MRARWGTGVPMEREIEVVAAAAGLPGFRYVRFTPPVFASTPLPPLEEPEPVAVPAKDDLPPEAELPPEDAAPPQLDAVPPEADPVPPPSPVEAVPVAAPPPRVAAPPRPAPAPAPAFALLGEVARHNPRAGTQHPDRPSRRPGAFAALANRQPPPQDS